MDYVLGFIFDAKKDKVLLIKKSRPSWQKGKLNGIGGKIENNETPLEAMIRECKEETNLNIKNWRHYATMLFSDNKVFVYSAAWNIELASDEGTGETLYQEFVDDVLLLQTEVPTVTNLPWLLTMEQDTGFGGILSIDYGEENTK